MLEKRKNEILRRLAIISGHLNKIKSMVKDDRYCIDVLNQSLAVQKALKQVDNLILDSHLHTCVQRAMKSKVKSSEKAIKELLELYKRSAR